MTGVVCITYLICIVQISFIAISVTRSTQRLSVEKSDKEDDPRSTASTPTKKKPAKRLSIKPGLEDVMETGKENLSTENT